MKLHIGCGSIRLAGYINIDAKKTPAVDRVMNATSLGEFANNSVDEIYSCHMLEHLDKKNGRNFLKECRRVLKVGGTIRLEVPDIEL